MGNGVKDLFLACVTAWFFFYGSILLFFNLWPFSLSIATITPVLLFLAAWWKRVPPPDSSLVTEIIGSDPIHGKPQDGKFFLTSVAHRGAPLDAPENSIIAFKMCAESGCKAIELDVSLTKDNVPIIFHDPTIDRLTGQHGVVREMTWEQLQKYDIAATHHLSDRFKGTKIASLEEGIKECLELNMRIIIDCKEKDPKIVKTVLDMYEKFPVLYKKAIVSGFNPFLIYSIRRANPGIVCSLAYRPFWYTANQYTGEGGPVQTSPQSLIMTLFGHFCDSLNLWMLNNFTYYFLGLSAILLHSDIVAPEDLRRWRERNLRVMAWTINQPVEKKYFSKILKVTYLTDTMIGEAGDSLNETK